jgi:hypothetical protein
VARVFRPGSLAGQMARPIEQTDKLLVLTPPYDKTRN